MFQHRNVQLVNTVCPRLMEQLSLQLIAQLELIALEEISRGLSVKVERLLMLHFRVFARVV
jgi:hypothetical protein